MSFDTILFQVSHGCKSCWVVLGQLEDACPITFAQSSHVVNPAHSLLNAADCAKWVIGGPRSLPVTKSDGITVESLQVLGHFQGQVVRFFDLEVSLLQLQIGINGILNLFGLIEEFLYPVGCLHGRLGHNVCVDYRVIHNVKKTQNGVAGLDCKNQDENYNTQSFLHWAFL